MLQDKLNQVATYRHRESLTRLAALVGESLGSEGKVAGASEADSQPRGQGSCERGNCVHDPRS